jgi:hypothetical protein
MRSLLTALVLTLVASIAAASPFKAHYGHYYATSYTDNTSTDIQTLCGKVGVTGINYRMRWSDVEPSDGTFVWTALDNVLTTIAGMGAASGGKPNNSCRLWVFIEYKLFQNGQGLSNPCPTWLKTSDGLPGYGTNTDSTASRPITGATNTSPIKITITGANFTNGDSIFIDNVRGNVAANGLWTIAGVSGQTFTLNGSHGNGAYTTGTGLSTKGGIYTCKLHDSLVLTKYLAMIAAAGAHFDGNANVEGYINEETALGFNNGYEQEASPYGGTYTGAAWTANLQSIATNCALSFPTSRCALFINQLRGNQAGLHDIQATIQGIANNQVCFAGPDILPDSAQLYNGNNQVYQVLISHPGCRANSAQNNSIAECPAGGNCNAIFTFAVQGTFGHLGKSNPLPPDDGLCINSYIWWNDSTSQQAKVDPTIQQNPYGAGWYGQCSCGGSEP